MTSVHSTEDRPGRPADRHHRHRLCAGQSFHRQAEQNCNGWCAYFTHSKASDKKSIQYHDDVLNECKRSLPPFSKITASPESSPRWCAWTWTRCPTTRAKWRPSCRPKRALAKDCVLDECESGLSPPCARWSATADAITTNCSCAMCRARFYRRAACSSTPIQVCCYPSYWRLLKSGT